MASTNAETDRETCIATCPACGSSALEIAGGVVDCSRYHGGSVTCRTCGQTVDLVAGLVDTAPHHPAAPAAAAFEASA